MNVVWIVVGLLVIGIGVVYALFRQEMRRAEERVASARLQIETRCGQMEYGIIGEDGTPVLALHGAGGGFDQGLLVSELMLGDGFRIIAPSRFGYLGGGMPEDHSIEAQADAYACLLDALGIDQVMVLAFSAGGPSGLQFALRHPERTQKLALISAVSYTEPLSDDGRKRLESGINRVIGSDFFYWAMLKLAPGEFLAMVGVPKDVQKAMSAVDRQISNTALEWMHPMSRRFPGILLDQMRDIPKDWPLEQIKAPTQVIHARDDTLVPFSHGEHSAGNIPGARFEPVDRGGHFLLSNQSAAGLMMQFLDRASTHSER